MTNFWDYKIWNIIIQFGIILIAILAANSIRRKVKFIRNSLLPSSVIAGLLIFILKFIPGFSDKFIDAGFMEAITYHFLGLGFVALSLKSAVKSKDSKKGVILDSGLITVNTYLVQAIVGLGITLLLSVSLFKELFHAAGLLLPLGFGQGTGQALNFGKVYESMGFVQGTVFGLSIAAIGFFASCIVGVIYLNVLKKQGKLTKQLERKEVANSLNSDIYAPDESPLTESVDKLTMQLAFIFAVYMLTFLLISGLSFLAEKAGNFGVNTLKPLLWGFNFLFGSLLAIVVKKVILLLRKTKIMNHTYINDYMMNRLSGFFFDVMIVAGIAAIDWQSLTGVLIPLIMVCGFGTLATFIFVRFVCRKIYPEYEYEGFFAMFGMLTGTASTGMILLREIDPNYETPAADNLVLQQLPAIIFGAPLLLLITFAGKSVTSALIVFGVVIAMFMVYNIILFRRQIFKRKK